MLFNPVLMRISKWGLAYYCTFCNKKHSKGQMDRGLFYFPNLFRGNSAVQERRRRRASRFLLCRTFNIL